MQLIGRGPLRKYAFEGQFHRLYRQNSRRQFPSRYRCCRRCLCRPQSHSPIWVGGIGLLVLNVALAIVCYALLKSGWKIKN